MKIHEEIEALMELVKMDYEHTLNFIDGVVRVSTSIRTIATAGWFALVAASVETGQAWLSVLAAFGVLALGLQDAYHGWLYAVARKRAIELERLIESFYKYLQRTSQSAVAADLLKNLHNHRFGQRSRIPLLATRPKVDPRTWESLGSKDRLKHRASNGLSSMKALGAMVAEARPRFFYRWLYGPLLVAAIALAVIGPGSSSSSEGPQQGATDSYHRLNRAR